MRGKPGVRPGTRK